jgi:hypothetical protein
MLWRSALVPRGKPGRPSQALTFVQAEAVLAASAGSRMHAYILLSLLTGARTEELTCGNTVGVTGFEPAASSSRTGITVRCCAVEHGRWHSEHDSGASGSSSAVQWARVCSFFVPWLHIRFGGD